VNKFNEFLKRLIRRTATAAIIFSCLVGCLNFSPTAVSALAIHISPLNIVWKMIGQIDKDQVLANIKILSGETPICTRTGCNTIANRYTGSEGLRWTKNYIHETLVALGYSVEVQDWSRSGYSDQNLIARKPGRINPEESIYLVAHLDGVGNLTNDRFPAADDNASGLADLLQMATILSGYSFNRTLVLLFSTGEEQGMLGVKSYLSQLTPEEISAIKFAVDVDMIGYDANGDKVMELWHGGHAPSMDLAEIMREIIQAYQLELTPVFVVGCG
jgi:acetylornithine deacetylase/succinyl-diaminopimelate desuccinylase-like protein